METPEAPAGKGFRDVGTSGNCILSHEALKGSSRIDLSLPSCLL